MLSRINRKNGFVTLLSHINPKKCTVILLGSLILAFGLYNVHSHCEVTEGGGLGLLLLLQHWFNISPAVSGLIFNLICYATGRKVLGRDFVVYSVISCMSFSAFYAVFEQFPPLWQSLEQMPLLAAVAGAVFVGVGCGLSVRAGGAPGGDDALAMSLSKLTKMKIQWLYLISDIIILALSLSYIPVRKITYSLLTVVLSGQLIGFIQQVQLPKKTCEPNESGPASAD